MFNKSMLMKLFVGLIIQEKTTFPIYLRLHSTPQKEKIKEKKGTSNLPHNPAGSGLTAGRTAGRALREERGGRRAE